MRVKGDIPTYISPNDMADEVIDLISSDDCAIIEPPKVTRKLHKQPRPTLFVCTDSEGEESEFELEPAEASSEIVDESPRIAEEEEESDFSDDYEDEEILQLSKPLRREVLPHHRDGLNLMKQCERCYQGGILADNIHTRPLVQLLSLVSLKKVIGGAKVSLLVCPKDEIENLKETIEKFIPQMKLIVLAYGLKNGTAKDFKALEKKFDIALTTYDYVVNDYKRCFSLQLQMAKFSSATSLIPDRESLATILSQASENDKDADDESKALRRTISRSYFFNPSVNYLRIVAMNPNSAMTRKTSPQSKALTLVKSVSKWLYAPDFVSIVEGNINALYSIARFLDLNLHRYKVNNLVNESYFEEKVVKHFESHKFKNFTKGMLETRCLSNFFSTVVIRRTMKTRVMGQKIATAIIAQSQVERLDDVIALDSDDEGESPNTPETTPIVTKKRNMTHARILKKTTTNNDNALFGELFGEEKSVQTEDSRKSARRF